MVCNRLKTNGLSRVLALALVTASGATAQEPVLAVFPQTQPAPRAGEPFSVTYEVTWPGAADRYVILPVEFEPIDWGVATPAKTVATVRDAVNVVSQTVEFYATERGTNERGTSVRGTNVPGEYEVPEVVVRYVAGDDVPAWKVAPLRSEKSGREAFERRLRAEPFSVRVAPRRRPYWGLYWGPYWTTGGLAALLAFGVLTALAVYRFRRRPVVAVPAAVPAAEDTVQGLLHAARQRRLDGQFYEFYLALSRAVSLLDGGGQVSDLKAKLDAWVKETGYRGVRPTEDDMDGAQREVERALAQQARDEG